MSYTKNNQWFNSDSYDQVDWSYIKRFVHFYRPVRGRVFLTIGLSLFFSLTAFAIPAIFAQVQEALQTQQVRLLVLALAAYLGIMLFQNGINFAISTLTSRIYTLLNQDILLAFYERLLNTSVKEFLAFKRNSNLFQRLIDAMAITGQYTGVIVGGSKSILTVIVFGAVIGSLSLTVLGVLLIGAAVLVGFVTHQTKRLRKKRSRTLGINYPLVSKMLEIINGLLTIKALSASVRATKDITSLVSSKTDAEYDESFTNAGVALGSGSIRSLTVLGAIATSFVLLINGHLALSEVFAIYVLIDGFLNPISELAGYYQGLAVLSINVKNYYEVLDLKSEAPALAPRHPARQHSLAMVPHGDGEAAGSGGGVAVLPHVAVGSPAPAHIAFRNVHFSYVDSQKVLDDFTLEIGPGEKVALIGKSGAGKTTLLRLLLDFMQPQQGEILLDGVNIREIDDKNTYRTRFGIVNQNDFLFNISLRDNLLFGLERPCSDEETAAILRQVNLWDDVTRLDKGLETVYDDDCFSGGQRQRFLIARALLRQPDIVLLDEPTSALDFENEREILAALDVLTQGKTGITIAHRLSTVRDADRVYVLDRGRIVGAGKHDDLYDTNAYYRELCDYNSFIV